MKRLSFLFVILFVTNIFAQDTGFISYGTSNATGGVTLSTYNSLTAYKVDGIIQIAYPNTGDVPYFRVRKAYTSQNVSTQTTVKIRIASPTTSLKMKMGFGLFNAAGNEGTSGLVEISNNGTVVDYQVNVLALSSFTMEQGKISFSLAPGQPAGNFTIYILGIWIVNNGIDVPLDIPGNGAVTLNAPTLETPIDGATNTGVSPILNWNASTGATSYGLQVSTDKNFSSFVVNQTGLTAISYTLSNLSANTIYYWKVNANSVSQTSSWSVVRSFNTGTSTTLPDPPTLGAPADGLTNFPLNGGTLNYTSVNGISAYQLELREDSQTGTLVINQVYTTSPITLNNLKSNQIYCWRLGSIGVNGIGWSLWRSFTTVGDVVISKPTLLSPANNSTGMVTPISFVWTGVQNALNYELQISRTNLFSNLEYSSTPLNNYQNVFILYANVKYYWRVRVITTGSAGEWSDVWNFTIGSITDVDDKNNIPTKFELLQNYPNPFNPVTSIKYEVSSIEYINITVYDILGREIVILVNGQKTPGRYEVQFDGSKLSSGMYVYAIRAGNFSATKKMILMK